MIVPRCTLTHDASRSRRRAIAAAIATAVALGAGACGGAAATSTPTTALPAAHPATAPAAPDAPTARTRMICASEAQRELAAQLGVTPVRAVRPTWIAGRYSCRYVYRDGSFTLAVEQFDDAAAARTRFAALVHSPAYKALSGLGQAAAANRAGSVVVRKDDDVLVVDPRSLPDRFGNPPDTRPNVALTIAATIMGCWTG